MNKSVLRSFSAWARRYLISNVCDRAQFIGVTADKVVPMQAKSATDFMVNGVTFEFAPSSRDHFVDYIKEVGWENAIEEIAYTWFNRILAIRFMEVNGYLENGTNEENIYVIGSVDSERKFPDAVARATELKYVDKNVVYKYQDAEDNAGLFRYILMRQCAELSKWMPDVFERVSDYTDLLLPETLLFPDGLIDHLTHDLNAEDFDISAEGNGQVEIFGWMYQFYIAEKKKAVEESKNKINKGTLPAKTQLFTPDWIVRYMVENSLGKIWVTSHDESNLKDDMKYYLEPNISDKEVVRIQEELKKYYQVASIRDIKFLDPCCGSGHVLVYAFDLFYRMYLEEGYTADMIPSIILENNIYGLDVDKRAIQLTSFALTMKARSYNKKLFKNGYHFPNVMNVHESNTITESVVDIMAKLLKVSQEEKEIIKECVVRFENAEYFGSLINNFENTPEIYRNLEKKISDKEDKVDYADVFEANTFTKYYDLICTLVRQAGYMSEQYDCVVTNPPYLNPSACGNEMKKYAAIFYPDSKADMFAMFIERCNEYIKKQGLFGMVTMQGWMSLESFEKLRNKMLNSMTIDSLLHLGARAFEDISGEIVQTAAFVVKKGVYDHYKGTYFRLVEAQSQDEKEEMYIQRKNMFYTNQNEFRRVSGSIYSAYWANENQLEKFEYPALGDTVLPRHGLATSDNDRFLKKWFEVDINKTSVKNKCDFTKKWFPMNKGGSFRKWYGNLEWVINYENDGKEIKDYAIELYKCSSRTIQNTQFYFKEGITWSALTSGALSFRWTDVGAIFGSGAHCAFAEDRSDLLYGLALMNSNVSEPFMKIVSTTMNRNVDDIRKTPFILNKKEEIVDLVNKCISISKADWDSTEISWDYEKHPYIGDSNLISEAEKCWISTCDERFTSLKHYEEQINKILSENYDVSDEIDYHIPNDLISVSIADRQKEIKALISYAVGCIMGRYSLKEFNLIFAGGELDESRYSENFKPCEYGVLPITDEQFFESDLCTRVIDFIKAVYGEDSLTENLKFIANALKPDSYDAPKKIIRDYLFNEFFDNHYQIYQHRPIYWQLDSGKAGGFRAIVYMHRFNENTLPLIRTEYIQDLRYKYEDEMQRQQRKLTDANTTAERNALKKEISSLDKKIVECSAYDDLLIHASGSIQNYVFDLDDGVKNNYAKFLSIDGDKNKNILTVIKL